MNAEKIVVILPAYNEELTIEETIRDFHCQLPEASIWIINNKSVDNTEVIARRTLDELGCAGGIIKELRQGKGNAVRRAFLNIEADIYILADADMTYPASAVRYLIAPIQTGEADMVVGDRHSAGNYAAENKRLLHGFGNRLVKRIVNFLFNADLKDIMSGYRVFSKLFVKNYPIMVNGFEIETDMTMHALDKRFRIVEIPVEYKDRPSGSSSKLNTFRDGFRVLNTIVNILRYYRPLFFYGSVAVVMAMLSIIVGVPVIHDWLEYNYIYHVPLAILATGFGIISIILMAIALILDSSVQQNRRNFENQLLKYL